jgi:5-methyltetrahydropteroyltriglutamate--homocysteine methyltransferase
MSRARLKELCLELPLFPVTSVGSFPKPDYLTAARSDLQKGKITAAELRAHEEKATAFWIEKQEELGVDVLVDGEQYRGDMVAYFAEVLPGFQEGGLVRSYGNRYYRKPVIVGEVKWEKPITVGWWRFAQEKTDKPVKGMLTGPYTLMDWSFNEHYPDRKTTCLAMAAVVRKEVEALIEAGCKIVQIDEPAISTRVEELPFALEAMQRVTEGLPAYFVTHICYGAFEHVYPKVLELAVNNIDLDMSATAARRLPLMQKDPFTKDISYGIVDPDCGLKTRTVEEALGKLRVIAEAAQAARKQF